jgi:putative hemolysin
VFAGAGWELLVILLLILLNGFFAAAEIAILTARRGRLEQLAENGDKAARVALDLAHDADRFLPTVQVGITLVGTLAAVFGGARVEENLAAWIATLPVPWLVAHNHSIAITLVVLGLAFVSLICGELVPKRVALQNAEPLARIVAYPMLILQRVTRPMIWVLQTVTMLILRLMGMNTQVAPSVSVEDIQHLIEAGGESGLLEEQEHRMAMEALRLGDRTVTEILRPRVDIDALDIDTPSDEVIGAMAMSGFSRVPVCEGDIDHIVGFVYIKDVFLQQYLGRPIDLRRLVRPPLFVPKTLTISRLLEQFQAHRTQLAIVLDEYGGTQGMVTLEDVFEMLVGAIHDEHRQDNSQRLVRREDGSWLVDGAANLHELQEALELVRWSEPPPRGVGTVAGLILGLLKRPPNIGDKLLWSGLALEVVDMDGPRIDRVLVARVAETTENEESRKSEG